jgi:myo-inositol-1(or 4)-monophosphatase
VTENLTDPPSLRAVAQQLATEAAEFVQRRRTEVFGAAGSSEAAPGGPDAIRSKSTPTDPVTIVDTETERLLRDRLAVLRPGEPVLGEEGGGSFASEPGQPTWVLDPIDGTVNFVYGIPAYAVSVGVQVDGESVAGAVANVALGVVYSAARGHGAEVWQDGRSSAMRCSGITDLSMALVGTGFAYVAERRARQAEILGGLLPVVRDIRRFGSCALDLCMVAAGQLDAYYEDGVHVWDWAAGALIATEAGAHVQLPGTEGPGLVVAGSPGIAGALRSELDRLTAV